MDCVVSTPLSLPLGGVSLQGISASQTHTLFLVQAKGFVTLLRLYSSWGAVHCHTGRG